MKLIVTIFTFCLTHLTFAQNEDSLMLVIDDVDISSVQSRDEIRTYFKDVSDLFLGVQNSRSGVLTESGFESPEYDSIVRKEQMINEFLLLKMREYLSVHHYPTRSAGNTVWVEGEEDLFYQEEDAIASITLVKIFVNAKVTSETLDLKKLYFPKFYPSYKRGDIYSGDLWNLLHGMYRQVKGEEYEDFEHGEDEQIERMIDELGLDRTP